jgi:hypothetical protein
MIAQSAIDALFFARYGVGKLPLMYALVGMAMFATTLGVASLLARVAVQPDLDVQKRRRNAAPVAICTSLLPTFKTNTAWAAPPLSHSEELLAAGRELDIIDTCQPPDDLRDLQAVLGT